MARYAKGRRAWGEDRRSGKRLLRRKMVEDGYIKGLLVAPDWREPEHPLDKPVRVTDAIAIRKPAPQLDKEMEEVGPVAGTDDVNLVEAEEFRVCLYIGPYVIDATQVQVVNPSLEISFFQLEMAAAADSLVDDNNNNLIDDNSNFIVPDFIDIVDPSTGLMLVTDASDELIDDLDFRIAYDG